MCQRSGIDGHKTNHSLCATLATRLHQGNVNEQIAMEMTGHRSAEGIRAYKRTAEIQIRDAAVHLETKQVTSKDVNEALYKFPIQSSPCFQFYNCNVNINTTESSHK